MTTRQGIGLLVMIVSVLVITGVFFRSNFVDARKLTCEDKDERIEQLSTELRIRTAELEVNRGMLRAAKKKLEQCSDTSP